MASRGDWNISQIHPKVFGSGPYLILQGSPKFFWTCFQHVPAELPDIAIFLKSSKYAQNSPNFMIKMLVCWVTIKFGWKLSRQFLGIFFHEKWPIFILFLELWRCQGTQNCSFWKFIWCITRATTYSLFWIGKTSQKGCLSSSKCPHPAVNSLRDAFLEIFLLASPYTQKE